MRRLRPLFKQSLVRRALPAPPDENNVSPVAISLVLVGFACLAVAGAVWYRKHEHKVKSKQRELPMNTGEVPQPSTGSRQPEVFSFDLSPQNSTGFGRLLAVFSSDGTRSRDSTSQSSSEETSPSPPPPRPKKVSRGRAPINGYNSGNASH